MFDLEKAGVWLDGVAQERVDITKILDYEMSPHDLAPSCHAFYPVKIGGYTVLLMTDEMSRVELDTAKFLEGLGGEETYDVTAPIRVDVILSTLVNCSFYGKSKVTLSALEECLIADCRVELVRGRTDKDEGFLASRVDLVSSELVGVNFTEHYTSGQIVNSRLFSVDFGSLTSELHIADSHLGDVTLTGHEFLISQCFLTEVDLCTNKYCHMRQQKLHDWTLEFQYMNVQTRWQAFVIDLCNVRYYAFTGPSPMEGFHLAMDKGDDAHFATSNGALLWETVLEDLVEKEEPFPNEELEYIQECIASRMKLLEVAYKYENGIPLSDELVTISPMTAVE